MSKIKSYLPIIFILIFLILYLRNFFHGQLFRSDDLELHGVRLANYYLALKQGQFPPRWLPNANFGFGYPAFIVTYVLIYAVSIIWYVLGAGIEWSLNLTQALCIIISFTGFIAIGIQKNRIYWGYLAGAVFLTAPYIMATVFKRGAIAELSFYALLPWVIYSLNSFKKNLENRTKIYVSIIIFSAFLLTHPPSILISLPILAVYSLTNKVFASKKFQLSVIASMLLVQFFWTPFLVEKSYVRAGSGFSTSDYFTKFPNPPDLIWSKWSYGGLGDPNNPEHMTYRVGLIAIVIISIVMFSQKVRHRRLVKFWAGAFAIGVFFLLPISKPFWELFIPIQSVQFPWRLLWIPAFATAMLLFELPVALSKKMMRFLTVFLLLVIFHNTIKYAAPISYIFNSNHDWLQHPSSSSSNGEFDVIGFDLNKNLALDEKLVFRKTGETINVNESIASSQESVFTQTSYSGSNMEYTIQTEVGGDIIQKTTYFPGFEAFVDNQKVEINHQDSEFPGRIIIPVSAGSHQIVVNFTQNTWDRIVGNTLSVLGVILFTGTVLGELRNRLKTKN